MIRATGCEIGWKGNASVCASRSLFLAVFVVSAFVGAADAAQRPNILMIVSEDNGPELGSYGEPQVRTPVLDQLAAEGVLFARAYVPQAGCSQSRAAYLTGLYPHQNGQIGLATWGFQLFREDTPNLVRSLKAAGYRCGLIGKLHINPESAFPFDFTAIGKGNFARDGLDTYAEQAAKFIAAGVAPFFLSINYPDAHRPHLRQIHGLPEEPLDPGAIAPLAYIGLDSPTLRMDTGNHYNCMARLDALVGDLLAVLDASGKADSTLVVYFGDHGADLIRGKRSSFEGGVRVPLVVRWPGRAVPGQRRAELTSTLDLVPTFLEAAGAESIPGLPGRSLIPLLEGRQVTWRQHLFTEFHLHSPHNYYPQRTVRNERFKLIHNLFADEVNPGHDYTIDKYYSQEEIDRALANAPALVREAYARSRRPPAYELYDLQADPFEFENLAGSAAYAAILAELQAVLQAWRADTRDPFLDLGHARRLQAEIAATRADGDYKKRSDPWGYVTYMLPRAE